MRKLHKCPCCHVVSSYRKVPGDSTMGHPEYEKTDKYGRGEGE